MIFMDNIGVHALFNVVSCKLRLPVDPPEVAVCHLNEKLPPDLRVLGIQDNYII